VARVRAGRLIESGEKVERVAPDDPRARRLYREYVRDEVLGPIEVPIDAETLAAEAPPTDLAPPSGALLLVTLAGEPVAIGGVRDLDGPVAEVKSMYVAPAARGRGLGRDILGRLEGIAASRGCRAVRLDSASHMAGAIALYRDLGYREIPAYNDGPIADHWFERELSPRRPDGC
jgi:ribosomal protein S18 acetylase RimI-like enzyme